MSKGGCPSITPGITCLAARNWERSLPAKVPAVLEMPMTTPAWRGAMSMWFTEKPPRAKPASPRVALVAASPAVTERAIGIASSAKPAPQNPVGAIQILSRIAVSSLGFASQHRSSTHVLPCSALFAQNCTCACHHLAKKRRTIQVYTASACTVAFTIQAAPTTAIDHLLPAWGLPVHGSRLQGH